MSRDALLYVVAAGEAILRYTDGVTFEAFAANDEKRAAVERQVFVIGEAAARLPDEWKQRRPEVPWRKIVGRRNLLAHGYWAIAANETIAPRIACGWTALSRKEYRGGSWRIRARQVVVPP